MPSHYRTLAIGAMLASSSVGCAHYSHQVGALTIGDEVLHARRPSPPIDTRIALATRDPVTNALSASFGGAVLDGTLLSTISGMQQVILYATASEGLPAGAPSLFLPLGHSDHLRIRGIRRVGANVLALELDGDRLGTDLLAAAMFSPVGVVGVASFPDGFSVLVRVRAIESWFVWATVWSNPKKPASNTIELHNELEVPVVVDKIGYRANDGTATVVVGARIEPGGDILLPLRDPLSAIDTSSIRITKRIVLDVPVQLDPSISPKE